MAYGLLPRFSSRETADCDNPHTAPNCSWVSRRWVRASSTTLP